MRAKTTLEKFWEVGEWLKSHPNSQGEINIFGYAEQTSIELMLRGRTIDLFSWSNNQATYECGIESIMFGILAEVISCRQLENYFDSLEDLRGIERRLNSKDLAGLIHLVLKTAFDDEDAAFTDFLFNYLVPAPPTNVNTLFDQLQAQISNCLTRHFSINKFMQITTILNAITEFISMRYKSTVDAPVNRYMHRLKNVDF